MPFPGSGGADAASQPLQAQGRGQRLCGAEAQGLSLGFRI